MTFYGTLTIDSVEFVISKVTPQDSQLTLTATYRGTFDRKLPLGVPVTVHWKAPDGSTVIRLMVSRVNHNDPAPKKGCWPFRRRPPAPAFITVSDGDVVTQPLALLPDQESKQ